MNPDNLTNEQAAKIFSAMFGVPAENIATIDVNSSCACSCCGLPRHPRNRRATLEGIVGYLQGHEYPPARLECRSSDMNEVIKRSRPILDKQKSPWVCPVDDLLFGTCRIVYHEDWSEVVEIFAFDEV